MALKGFEIKIVIHDELTCKPTVDCFVDTTSLMKMKSFFGGKNMSEEIKKIVVDVDSRLPRVQFQKLKELQGNLKSLSEENYEKLRDSILKRGFFVPVFCWKDPAGELKLLDGHQRMRVLGKLAEEGYAIPEIPVVVMNAVDEAAAKEKLLSISSQYGKVEKEGLYEFLQGLDEELIVTDFKLPEVDGLKFLDEFFEDESKIEPLEPVPGDLKSVGGNGVKMLQLFYLEDQHQEVLQLISALQGKFNTENATDTVLEALRHANNQG